MDRNRINASVFPICAVALRKESVDRNRGFDRLLQALPASLSARRAWIEIPWAAGFTWGRVVALRKESVDRNTVPDGQTTSTRVALRKESVDRNVNSVNMHLPFDVALRKESVDRN